MVRLAVWDRQSLVAHLHSQTLPNWPLPNSLILVRSLDSSILLLPFIIINVNHIIYIIIIIIIIIIEWSAWLGESDSLL